MQNFKFDNTDGKPAECLNPIFIKITLHLHNTPTLEDIFRRLLSGFHNPKIKTTTFFCTAIGNPISAL